MPGAPGAQLLRCSFTAVPYAITSFIRLAISPDSNRMASTPFAPSALALARSRSTASTRLSDSSWV